MTHIMTAEEEAAKRAEYAAAFVRALENTRGQPLHDYLIEVVTTLSSDRAKWLFELEESNNPPCPR